MAVAPSSVASEVILGAAIGAVVFLAAIIVVIIVITRVRRHINDTKVHYVSIYLDIIDNIFINKLAGQSLNYNSGD